MKTILENTLGQLILMLLGPIVAATGLQLATGKLELRTVPAWVWVVVILLVFSVPWLRGRLKKLHEPSLGYSVLYTPSHGWTKLSTLTYQGAKWIVRVPTPGPLSRGTPLPSDVDIETPPRCPNCETKLEENSHFFYGFIWQCVACQFKKRNRESFYKEAGRARRLAQRHYEKTRDLNRIWQQ